ncbi:MAG: 1-(5-phosphoribosyl)-5-[(5-phosphoribosylamino)methylideneamino]imidazole-4-carboxamide isomerase [Actinobacteria bacterium]|nr:1-(5-phosphoribosyl)-5-[(5-phosphoribosylamino)methylideneamino]imidazole-4-carboxamide isomerase [Actinomycetota bacterium]
MFNVIPAIDILDGNVVRLSQGDYNRVDHYHETPSEWAKKFAAHGAQRLHIVDLNGAKDKQLTNLDAIKSIRQSVSCEIELGGGIRSLESAQLLIDLGINYLVLGSLLTEDTPLAMQIIETFPGQIIAGLDIKNGNLAIEGWRSESNTPITTMIDALNDRPISAIISTDVERDGMLTGPNIEQLLCLAADSTHPIIASGGVHSIDDILALKNCESKGISGVIVGKAILSGTLDISTLF